MAHLLNESEAMTSQAEALAQQLMTSLLNELDELTRLQRNVSRVIDATRLTQSRVNHFRVSIVDWSSWLSSRTSVSGQRSFAVLGSTCS